MSDAARVKEKENGKKDISRVIAFRGRFEQISSIPWKLSNQFVQSNHHYGEWVVNRSWGTWLLVKLDNACLTINRREKVYIFSFEF